MNRFIQRLCSLPRRWRHQAQLKAWRSAGLVGGEKLVLEGDVEITAPGRIQLGREVRLGKDVYLAAWPDGSIRIGNHSYLGRWSIVLAHQLVEIGDHCLIAPGCHITDVNHGIAPGELIRLQPLESVPVRIGDDVWVGAGCSILPGVTIGRGAVVGARAVVTRDVPPGAIVAGVPARVIRYRDQVAAQ